ncbi:DUF2079 domain-containing protein [Actinoplanes sp. NPDC051494]|uniref:DUF2079 domain-containing protein n=1 Tax=Actinoplanes sp. NPDC051494 TaxID=3363907 RepID=UPI0037A1AC85
MIETPVRPASVPAVRRGTGRPLAWSMAAVLAAGYTALAVRAHQHLGTTGFDLGIFEQVVRSYAAGQPGLTPLKGTNFPQLGDHFSPILVVLAPFYRVFPSPLTLLVAQAVLLAVAVVPIAGLAHRTLGPRAAVVIGTGYGLSWGIAQAVGFDFHEICFAVPLLAASLAALAGHRHRVAALWALPLVLVKEDLGLTVAVVGVLIAVRGSRRTGWSLAAAGVTGTLLAVLVVVPALNPGTTYAYGGGLFDTLRGALAGFAGLPVKTLTVLALLAPTALLAVRSPLLWVAMPTLAWRFTSDNPAYWGTGYHYSAVLMPVLFVAFADALRRWRDAGRSPAPPLLISLTVTAALVPAFPLAGLAAPGTWRTDPRAEAAHRVLSRIPDDATVAASNRLVPQLTGRAEVTLFGGRYDGPDPEFIVVDTQGRDFPLEPDARRRLIGEASARGFRTVARDNGFLLLHR